MSTEAESMTLGQVWARIAGDHEAKRAAAHARIDALTTDEALRAAAHEAIDAALGEVESSWGLALTTLRLRFEQEPAERIEPAAPDWQLLALLGPDGRDIDGATIGPAVDGQVTVRGVPRDAPISAMRIRQCGVERVVPLEDCTTGEAHAPAL